MNAIRPAWYRFLAPFGRRRGSYIALTMLAAVPDPVIPAVSTALAGLAALVLANLVAAVPGQRAARTPTATVLRAE